MSRPIGKHNGTETARQIKETARKQMRERGTAGLTLRGIAKEMNITAPAIYNYYPRLDDLITALIVDTFNALAEAMGAAAEASRQADYGSRIKAIVLAYRQWAVDNPVDFELIYGNPIPGYVAPFELTAPLARKPFLELMEIYIQAWQERALVIPPEYQEPPEIVTEHVLGWARQVNLDMPAALVGMLMSGWGRIHGLVMLELTHHIQPVIGDAESFYQFEVDAYLQRIGLGQAIKSVV